MRLKLQRFSDNGESTLGLMYAENNFACYTLEDTFRKEKIDGETRIDAGLYEIVLTSDGRMHDRYIGKFGDIHKGMLRLKDVPNFEGVLIHIGNTIKDTSGCILVASSCNNNNAEDGFVGGSTKAYKYLYAIVLADLLNGRKVFIEVADEEYRTS